MTGAADLQPFPPRRWRWWVLWLGMLLTILIHLPSMLSDDLRIEGRYVGPDSYMRVQRVLELHTHGRWYDAETPRTNAPYGETLHWTRPLDTILLAGAWIGSTVTDYRNALETWGAFMSPFLLLLLVAVWRYGTRGLLSDGEFLLSLVALPLLPMFDFAYALGRPDHHGLLNLLFVSGLVLMFRIVTQSASPRSALAVGVVSGAALWVSVAAITTTTFFGAALALLWLWRGQPYLKLTVFFMIGLLATISAALLIELPPSDWAMPIYDSISVVHWLLAATAALSWVVVAGVVKRVAGDGSVRLRLVGVVAGALVPALAVALVFPRFFLGPFADYDAVIITQFLSAVSDNQPLLPNSRERAAVFVLQLGPALIAVIYALLRLRRGDQSERQLMAFLLLGFACFVPLTIAAIRWADYAQALVWLPLTLVTLAIFNVYPSVTIAGQLVRLRAPLAAIILLGPFLSAAALAPRTPSQQAVGPGCNWQQMAGFLSQQHAASDGSAQLLLTDFFRGPALVWATPYNVVGTPFGNPQSLGDTFGFFGALDDDVPREIAERRNVDLVLVCRGSGERRLYEKAGISTMFTQLSDGAPPQWLERVQLPDRLADAFRLYRVSR